MTITDIIAFFAFIIALYGAILSTYTAINEFFRIKLSYLNINYLTLAEGPNSLNNYGEHIGVYNKNLYTIAIFVRITNKSKNPTTINEFILNNKYVLDSSFDSYYSSIATSFEYYDGELISHTSKMLHSQTIKPLLKLEPLSTYEGYLIFNNLEEIPSKFSIKVNAVQKSKTFHLHFSIANDYRNEIVPR